jgi:hypothetical protein
MQFGAFSFRNFLGVAKVEHSQGGHKKRTGDKRVIL